MSVSIHLAQQKQKSTNCKKKNLFSEVANISICQNVTNNMKRQPNQLPPTTKYYTEKKTLTYNKKKTNYFFWASDFLQSNTFTPQCVEECNLESKRGLLLGMYSDGRLRNLFL